MDRITSLAYTTVFKKTSTFVAAAVFVAFFYERGVDTITDTFFDNYNKGRQWKDIKHLYEK